MAKGARPEQPADAGREQDVLVLTAYYSEHKPELASREKVEQVIASFQRKARAAATASVNSIGPSWRELMYDSITKRSGVDPREYWDLAVASEVAKTFPAAVTQPSGLLRGLRLVRPLTTSPRSGVKTAGVAYTRRTWGIEEQLVK